jgi:hypothetical protein
MPSSHEPDRGEQSQLLASLVAFLESTSDVGKWTAAQMRNECG